MMQGYILNIHWAIYQVHKLIGIPPMKFNGIRPAFDSHSYAIHNRMNAQQVKAIKSHMYSIS